MQHKHPSIMKTLIYPFLVTIIMTVLFSYVIFHVSLDSYQKINHEQNMQSLRLNADIITKNKEIERIIIDDLVTRSEKAALMVLENRAQLSDEYLLYVSELFDIELMYWFNETGLQLYAANGLFNGYQIQENTPLYAFMTSELSYHVEEIRRSVNRDIYVKFAYFKDTDGQFLQVGVTADSYSQLTEKYSYQQTVKSIVDQNQHVVYALVTDLNLVAIADTDVYDIGNDYSHDEDYLSVLSGETLYIQWYYPRLKQDVIEYVTPIYNENNEVIGVLAAGYSLEPVRMIRLYLFFAIFSLSLIILFMMGVIQYHRVVLPIERLNKTIASYDIKHKTFQRVNKQDELLGFVYHTLDELAKDIQEHTKIITEQAYTDYLLHIPNRLSIFDKINSLITSNTPFGLIFIDVDDFKNVNDTKGHYFGDLLLSTVAKTLQNIQKDVFLGRYGGDELIIVCEYTKESDIQNLITLIYKEFKKPVSIEQTEMVVDLSMGISIFPKDDIHSEELVRKANLALHYVKSSGKRNYKFYDEVIENEVQHEHYIEQLLKDALTNDGFKLLYQPQVDINTGEIYGIEALLRFRDHRIGPDEFIPIAEKNGLIQSIGRLVIFNVLKTMKTLRDEGYQTLPVHINFSVNQFKDASIVSYVSTMLQKFDIEPEYVIFEITESSFIHNEALAFRVLSELRKLGLKIALDDFGMGQSGINYLTKFDFDIVKLDKILADKYLNEASFNIYYAITELAKTMNFTIFAEGIETEEQIALLKKTKCDYIQGYYYYKPLEITKIKSLIMSSQSL